MGDSGQNGSIPSGRPCSIPSSESDRLLFSRMSSTVSRENNQFDQILLEFRSAVLTEDCFSWVVCSACSTQVFGCRSSRDREGLASARVKIELVSPVTTKS